MVRQPLRDLDLIRSGRDMGDMRPSFSHTSATHAGDKRPLFEQPRLAKMVEVRNSVSQAARRIEQVEVDRQEFMSVLKQQQHGRIRYSKTREKVVSRNGAA